MGRAFFVDHDGNERDIDLGALFKATLPQVKCSAGCGHGCSIEVPENGDWIPAAIAQGWIVQLWRTKYSEHVGDHVLAFCDPICTYEYMRRQIRATGRMGERMTHVCMEHDLQFSPSPSRLGMPTLLPHEGWLQHMMLVHETKHDFERDPSIAAAEAPDGSTIGITVGCGPYCDGIGELADDLEAGNTDLPGKDVPRIPQSIAEALEIVESKQKVPDCNQSPDTCPDGYTDPPTHATDTPGHPSAHRRGRP